MMKNSTNFWYSHLGLILLILLLTNCAKGILVEEASEYRDELTFAELMDPEYKSSEHVHNSYFTPMGDATHALHDLEGTLTVPQVVMKIKSPKYKGDWWKSYFLHYFPGFSVSFFTYKDYLIPENQGLLEADGSHKAWDIILSPGRVWSEPGDHGMSRASFPFVITPRIPMGAFNGIATFLYDNKRVSAFRFQIVQQSGDHYQFYPYGQIPLQYVRSPIGNLDELKTQFAEKLKRQTPIHPWAELEKMYDSQVLKKFSRGLAAQQISATGVIMDGAIFLQPCMTPFGQYPYPREMRHNVKSVSKSMGAALTMLALAEKYGDELFDLKIADYVKVTAKHDGWDDVTFGDALNMATGIGDEAPYRNPLVTFADENKPKMRKFFVNEPNSAKQWLDFSFSYGNYPWGPGEILRYNDINTFVLAAAMDSFLKSRESTNVNLWDVVTRDVLKPIGIHQLPLMHTRESDGSVGLPHFGFGLYPTVDDTAKIATLLQNEGEHDGIQLLSKNKLSEALCRKGIVGLPSDHSNRYGDRGYHMSFWYEPIKTEDGRYFQIPFMEGYGGNRIILAPNGVSSFIFTGAGEKKFLSFVQATAAIKSIPYKGMTNSIILK
jgi:CubicO group peptidase (beta-lactamase class C family)